MKRLLFQLALPLSLLMVTVVIVWQWPWLAGSMPEGQEINAFFVILPLLPYVIFIIGTIMGWRYNNGGLIFTSLLLCLCYFIFASLIPNLNQPCLSQGILVLLPLNLLFFSWHSKRRLLTPFGVFSIGLLMTEVMLLILFTAPELYQPTTLWGAVVMVLPSLTDKFSSASNQLCTLLSSPTISTIKNIALPALLAGSLTLAVLLIRFWRNRDILLVGYATAIFLVFLAVFDQQTRPLLIICFTAAGLAMLVSTVEASFFMAYYDDLTDLPGRRSLNETMLNLGRRYAIAMLDIDHFKKFNDTYGHKTGDDVLRMVASIFSMTGGGAKTFRYGGEEFTAIFPGKTASEALPYLEKLRKNIAESSFSVRSKTRKKKSAKDRGKAAQKSKQVNVTISIGVAESSKKYNSPEEVIKAADAILYKAKKAGRNCVKKG